MTKAYKGLFVLVCGVVLIGCSSKITYIFDDPQQYPDFILHVYPEPGSVGTRSTGEICVDILIQPLLRPGDHIEEFSNIRLSLDGRRIRTISEHEHVDMSAEGLWDAQGETQIASGPWSDYICWQANPQSGQHDVELLLWTSTGENLKYRWQFDIVD